MGVRKLFTSAILIEEREKFHFGLNLRKRLIRFCLFHYLPATSTSSLPVSNSKSNSEGGRSNATLLPPLSGCMNRWQQSSVTFSKLETKRVTHPPTMVTQCTKGNYT